MFRRQKLVVLNIVLSYNIRKLFICEVTRSDKESPICSRRLFERKDVTECKVTNVYPEICSIRRNLLSEISLQQTADNLIAGV